MPLDLDNTVKHAKCPDKVFLLTQKRPLMSIGKLLKRSIMTVIGKLDAW